MFVSAKNLRSRLTLFLVPLLWILMVILSRPACAQTDSSKPIADVAALLAEARQADKAKNRAENVRLLNEALAKARDRNDSAGEAYALAFIGFQDAADAKWDASVQSLQKALEFFKDHRVKEMQVATLSVLARVNIQLNSAGKALDYAQQVIDLSDSPIFAQQKMEALLLKGLIYVEKEQWPLAAQALEPALPFLERSGDKDRLSLALGVLSFGYIVTGDHVKAMEFSERTLDLRGGLKNRSGEALALTALAAIYVDLGQFQQSRDTASEAMRLWSKLGQNELTVFTQLILAEAYRQQKQPQLALDCFTQVLPLLRKSSTHTGLAFCLVGIGGSYRQMLQPARALPYYEEAAQYFHTAGNLMWEGQALNSQGEICHAIGQESRARDFFRQALAVLTTALTGPDVAGEPLEEAATLYNMAVAEEEMGQIDAARTNLNLAVERAETFRSTIGGQGNTKISFLERILYGLHRAIALQIKSNRPDAAFALVQKVKARVLLDLMVGGKVDITRSLTEEQARHERELRQAADRLNLAMVQESVLNEVGAKKRYAALKEQLMEAERSLQSYEDSLYALHPELAGKRVATTASLQDAGRFLPDDTALLEFVTLDAKEFPDMTGADLTLLFVVTSKNGAANLQVYPVNLSRAALTLQVDAFGAACADPRKAYQAQAKKLYDLLIRPAASVLNGKKRLVLCPDGPLWGLPFAALHDGKQFLLQRFELSYAYSATGAWASLNGRKPDKPHKSLLALGNPDFGSADRFGDPHGIPGQRPIGAASRPIDPASRPIGAASRPIDPASRPIGAASRQTEPASRPIGAASRLLMVPRGGRITKLPGTQREVESLGKLVPGAVIYTGSKAQESVVKQMAGQYRYLHLASHAFFNDASPLLSSIVLAQPPPGSQEDGFLTARELFDMDLHADMVVLSACNTARGARRSGEGVIGLTWALFVAGVPTQVVSQWAVDDASTATLMGTFYKNLTSGKSAALRIAELRLRRDGKHAHPYFWAPFTLMGDWR